MEASESRLRTKTERSETEPSALSFKKLEIRNEIQNEININKTQNLIITLGKPNSAVLAMIGARVIGQ